MAHSKGFTPPRGQKKRTNEMTPLGEIVRRLMQEQVFAVGSQLGRLSADWSAVVGERLAEETAPRALEGGVLTIVSASGAWGTQVGFLADQIAAKANDVLGEQAVREVRVTVAPEGLKPLQRND